MCIFVQILTHSILGGKDNMQSAIRRMLTLNRIIFFFLKYTFFHLLNFFCTCCCCQFTEGEKWTNSVYTLKVSKRGKLHIIYLFSVHIPWEKKYTLIRAILLMRTTPIFYSKSALWYLFGRNTPFIFVSALRSLQWREKPIVQNIN